MSPFAVAPPARRRRRLERTGFTWRTRPVDLEEAEREGGAAPTDEDREKIRRATEHAYVTSRFESKDDGRVVSLEEAAWRIGVQDWTSLACNEDVPAFQPRAHQVIDAATVYNKLNSPIAFALMSGKCGTGKTVT